MTTPDDLGTMIGYRLKEAQQVLRARMDGALRDLGLTTAQYVCLELLHRTPGASHSDLARAVFVTRQSMNTLLAGLTDRGLVERMPGEGGRAVPVRLTETGEELLARAQVVSAAVEARLVSGLSADQRRGLHEALGLVIEALDE